MLEAYLADTEDAHLPRALALQSQLPPRLRPDGHTMDDEEIPYSVSPDGTSMMISGNPSLPALNDQESVSSGFDIPRTPRSYDEMPSAPLMTSMYADLDDVDGRHLHSHPTVLECPMDFIGCTARFTIFEFDSWFSHSLDHFGSDGVSPPCINWCVFCREEFGSSSARGPESWKMKLSCAFDHHTREGLRLADAQFPDVALFRYLWENHVLTVPQWKELMKVRPRTGGDPPPSPPRSPDSGASDQRMMVMETHRRRNRGEERQRRREQEMIVHVATYGNSDSDSDRTYRRRGRDDGGDNSSGQSSVEYAGRRERRGSVLHYGRWGRVSRD